MSAELVSPEASLAVDGYLLPVSSHGLVSYLSVPEFPLLIRTSVMLDAGPSRLLCPWDSPGKNTRLGCYSFLQKIFLTQGLDPGIEPRSPAFQADSLPSEPPGKPCHITPFHLNYLFKGLISKYSHILGYWGLGFQHTNWGTGDSLYEEDIPYLL